MTERLQRDVLGSAPIPGASPSGTSVKYDPDFDRLVAEIGKLESVEGRATLRWQDVVQLAETILATKSKDLLVAAYLALGLQQREGYAGLAAGLKILADLAGTYWETCFPELARLRGRQAALQWIADRSLAVLETAGDASESDRPALDACVQAVGALQSISDQRFGENAPDLGPFERALRGKLDGIPSAATETEFAAPGESAASASAEAAPAPASIDSPDGARAALAEMRERRIQAAAVLRAAQPADPWPYRLLREAVWEELADLPASAEGVLEQSGGDAEFLDRQEARLASGEAAAVVEDCEARLPSDPLWMDLSFLAYRALEAMGRPYAAARRAVLDAGAALARRLPGVLTLRFADGRPLASEEARLWLRHEGEGEAAGGDATEAALAEARKLLARKAFHEATALLLKRHRALSGPRERFVCRLALAKLCLEGGRADLALPQLEALDEEARRRGLEDWEPGLMADLARSLWTGYKASATPERAEPHFARLCRLDPATALGTNGIG